MLWENEFCICSLQRFIVRAWILVSCVVVVVGLLGTIFESTNLVIIEGFSVGTLISILKFKLTSRTIRILISCCDTKRNVVFNRILLYTLSYVILLGILIISIKMDIRLFLGVVAGILVIPCVVSYLGFMEICKFIKMSFGSFVDFIKGRFQSGHR